MIAKSLVPMLMLILVLITPAHAGPANQQDHMWYTIDEVNPMRVDYRLWDEFLHKFVYLNTSDNINYLAYEKMTKLDRKELHYFIHQMQKVSIHEFDRRNQVCYWLNLYNALVVDMFLQYPNISNIRDIQMPHTYRIKGPWGAKIVRVDGEVLSLNDIENKLLRVRFPDVDLLYLLFFGAKGSPNLQNQAITPENIETLKAKAAHDFVNHTRAVRFDRDNELFISSMYWWHKQEFNNTDVGILEHLRRWANPDLKACLNRYQGRIRYNYDWRVNSKYRTRAHLLSNKILEPMPLLSHPCPMEERTAGEKSCLPRKKTYQVYPQGLE